jgi:hypothetical protein
MEQSHYSQIDSRSSGQNIPSFYGTQRFISCSQEPATGTYPEPVEFSPYTDTGSRDSVVTRLRAGRGSSIPGRGREFCSSLPRSDRLWDSTGLLSHDNWEFSPGIKRPVCETDDSAPSSANV